MSYIGQGLGQGQAERFVYTASGGETSVTLDDDGRGISYTPNQLDVYLNGVKLKNGTDFTATTGTSITGLTALTASDIVEVVALSIFTAADTVPATGGTFTGTVKYQVPIVQTYNTINTNITLDTNYNGFSVGPVSIASGYSVTVPSGANWTII